MYHQAIVWSVNYASALKRAGFLLLALSVVPSYSQADDLVDAKQLDKIYDYSGVDSHLSWVLSVVQQESIKAQQFCETRDALPDIEKTLTKVLAADALRTNFIGELSERITPTQRDIIVSWTQSEAGQQVYKAEADSLDSDEQQFDTMYKTFLKSENNTVARAARMSEMLSDTGAVYFISALNTEISALVTFASVCSASAEDISKSDAMVKEERSGEALYRAFMRQELVTPAKVVYQDVSDESVDAYIEFAKSDAGGAYFTALIKGVRAVLSDRVEELKLTLESL